MKITNQQQLIEQIHGYDKVIIYGAGKVAHTLLMFMLSEKIEIDVFCLVVTDITQNPSDIAGVPVCSICDLKEYSQDSIVIIATFENVQNEIQDSLKEMEFRNVRAISNVFYAKMRRDNPEYAIDTIAEIQKMQRTIKHIEQRVEDSRQAILRTTVLPRLPYLVLNILDHCNLRCQGCDHFACIADERLIPLEVVKRDLERLSVLLGGVLTWMGVMGGEPLLHPQLTEILVEARKYFPQTNIRLTTNGLLLPKQDDIFWNTCRDNKITIVCTKYPIHIDYDAIRLKAEENQVNYQYFEGTGDGVLKYSYKKTMDLTGSQNPLDSYQRCDIANYGNTLCEGKLYGCPMMQAARIFNKKFNQNLYLDEGDCLDIYKVQSEKEILEFSAKAKGFCRYCNVDKRVYNIPWQQSAKEISEWI